MHVTRRAFNQLIAATALASSTVAARAAELSLPAYDGPWTPLFNGRNLDGWSFYQNGVGQKDTNNAIVIEKGEIHMLGPRYRPAGTPFGHIATEAEYGDYHLRLEFRYGDIRYEPRLLAKRNSGILYHMYPQRDRVWPNSIEFQLEESDVGDAILINTRCYPGADLGGTPAWPAQIPLEPRPVFTTPPEPRQPIERQRVIKNGNFERLGQWNVVELLAVGNRAAHLVNGRIVASLYEIEGQDVVDRKRYHPLTRGRIGLELECAEVFFRRIEIRRFKTA
jgi:Domain of Unknown Function (DUF1080)